MMTDDHATTDIEFKTLPTRDLSEEERAAMFGLFDSCYRQANHAYLQDTIDRLEFASLARQGETLVGFGLGELRIMDLPRLPQSAVVLGGLTCVVDGYRRRGLGTDLGHRNIVASARGGHDRMLLCGRAAHPAGFRVLVRNKSAVPQRDATPTSWQQEIGQVIADAYGVAAFDPLTFACAGSGKPIGYPVLEQDVLPAEWELFRAVDRDCGDSLLGIVWISDAPPGW